MRRPVVVLCAALWCSPAAAQVPVGEPPGPYVIDLRVATAGLPTATPFYSPVGRTVEISSRGFGLELGGHVYFGAFGVARLGVGASFLWIRGSSPDTSATMHLLAPQVSVNFGSANGWSYLSAGIGTGRIETDVRGESGTGGDAHAETRSLPSVNLGGGARWFLSDHLGVGFDVRFHRLAAGSARDGVASTPRVTVLTASVGISVK